MGGNIDLRIFAWNFPGKGPFSWGNGRCVFFFKKKWSRRVASNAIDLWETGDGSDTMSSVPKRKEKKERA